MKSKILQASFLTSLLFALLFTGCKKDSDNNNNNGGDGTTGGGAKPNEVSISGFAFSPSSLTVTSGTTITWTNKDSAPHTVTADDNSFTSSTLNQGDTYVHKFTSAGTVNYHCNIHPSMKASVTVQ